jgi:type III secretion system (T3SS) SseB-like protein
MTGLADFETTTYYVQRVPGEGGAPAVAALGPPGAGYLALYSSLEALAAQAGECDWAAAPGVDLLELVPPRYGVVVDPGGPQPAVLAAWAISCGVVISGADR